MCENINMLSAIALMVSALPSMTLSIPAELHALIKKHNHIRWSEIARRAMWEYAQKLEMLDRLTSKSTLTDKDVEELDRRIKKAAYKQYEKRLK